MKIIVVYDTIYGVAYNVPDNEVTTFVKTAILYKKSVQLLYNYSECYEYITLVLDKKNNIVVNPSTEQIFYKGKSYTKDNFTLEPKMSLVQFEYNGGTNYGETRYVRVDREDDKYLVGKDLQKDEERRYLKSKMRNFVRLV